MIIGGGTSEVEILDLTSDAPVPCSRPMDSPTSGPGTFIDFKPHVCSSHCFSYDQSTDTWDPTFIINGCGSVYGMASTTLDDGTWLMSGGTGHSCGGPDYYRTDYIRSVGPAADTMAAFETSLPLPLEDHNLVKINSTHLFLVNGYPNSEDIAYIYEMGTGVWTQMPPASLGRSDAIAGLAVRSTGTREIIVSGGGIQQSEAFSLETLTWRYERDFPVSVSKPATVQTGDTFLVVGGVDMETSESLDTIYRFEPDSRQWTLLPQRISVPRSQPTAFFVPSYFC